jgi:hypothetical protein
MTKLTTYSQKFINPYKKINNGIKRRTLIEEHVCSESSFWRIHPRQWLACSASNDPSAPVVTIGNVPMW